LTHSVATPDVPRGYLGAAHATCNLRAAAHKRKGTRHEQQLVWSRIWFEPIPPNVVLSSDFDAS
jgi:hypothetical protein